MRAALSHVLRSCAGSAGVGVGVGGGRCSCSFSSFSSTGVLALRRPESAAFYTGGVPAAGGWRPGLAMRVPPRRGLATMRMNRQIRAPMVRVVDMSGDELGVLSRDDALAAAKGG